MSRPRAPKVTGVALVDKPAGCTSHDVVQRLRRALGQSQVGHTGTLDPAATGLMVVTLGRATRIGRFIESTDKVYVGTIRLGRATTTWDAEGDLVAERPVSTPMTRGRIEPVLSSLVGRIDLPVPAFSAVKVSGERLHARARRGEAFDLVVRPAEVRAIELIDLRGVDLVVRAEVAKGTYIRSLAVEVGARLGFPAHLAALRRVRVGPHRIEDAVPPERFDSAAPPIIDASLALAHFPAVTLDPIRALDVAHGRRIALDLGDAEAVRLLSPGGTLLGIGHPSAGHPGLVEYDVVLVRPEEVAGSI